jgi:hypothetical protein
MRRHRTTALGILVTVLLAGLLAAAATATARGGAGGAVPKLVFPLVAKTDLWDNYGDPRPNGRHQGIDMENPWHAPAVAVEGGRVEYAQSNLGGCMLYLYGRSGTMYLYIHLNNDLTAKNDNRGGCVSDNTFTVPDGAKVSAGQQVAWVGDSGDANGNPHLHFEVHPNGGMDVDPYRFLSSAAKPLFAARTGSVFSLALRGELVSAGAGSATVDIEHVRQYPGGSWLDVDSRAIELTVPLGTTISPSLRTITGSLVHRLKSPVPVAAFTVKANATPEAIVGAPGELVLARVAPAP